MSDTKLLRFSVNIFVEVPAEFGEGFDGTEYLSVIENLRVIRGSNGKFTDETFVTDRMVTEVVESEREERDFSNEHSDSEFAINPYERHEVGD